jgi:hypothetical protein
MQTLTSKKDRLNTGLYYLPRLQEIVVLGATTNTVSATCCTKAKAKPKHSYGLALYLV